MPAFVRDVDRSCPGGLKYRRSNVRPLDAPAFRDRSFRERPRERVGGPTQGSARFEYWHRTFTQPSFVQPESSQLRKQRRSLSRATTPVRDTGAHLMRTLVGFVSEMIGSISRDSIHDLVVRTERREGASLHNQSAQRSMSIPRSVDDGHWSFSASSRNSSGTKRDMPSATRTSAISARIIVAQAINWLQHSVPGSRDRCAPRYRRRQRPFHPLADQPAGFRWRQTILHSRPPD